MTLYVHRTKMAMKGNFYSYDGYVPLSQVPHKDDVTYMTLLGDKFEKFVSLEEATRPESQRLMPKGWDKYEAWQKHEKQAKAVLLSVAKTLYPELSDISEWPTVWIECPDLTESHDLRSTDLFSHMAAQSLQPSAQN